MRQDIKKKKKKPKIKYTSSNNSQLALDTSTHIACLHDKKVKLSTTLLAAANQGMIFMGIRDKKV